MPLFFWHRAPRRADSSTASKTSDSAAIAGVSPPPSVAVLDRKVSRYSLLETIAACSVVAGIVVEDWDAFGMFYTRPDWAIGRVAAGGAVVAIGIVLELWFGSRSSKAERKIRDWYALRVAELNVKAQEEANARAQIIGLLKDADERIAEMQRDTALANERAETERLARLKLQREVSGRGFTREEFESLSAAMTPFAGQDVIITTDTSDVERVAFATWVKNALGNARWRIRFDPGLGIGGRDMPAYAFPAGLFIQATPDERSQTAGKELMKVLHAQGKSVMFNLSPAPPWLGVETSQSARGEERTHNVCRVWVAVREAPRPYFPDLETT
jgi:hypothetical protein